MYTHFSVLSGNFYFIYFAVLEFSEIMTELGKRLKSWSTIKKDFKLLPPLLELLDIVVMIGFVGDEVILEVLLFTVLVGKGGHEIKQTHSYEQRQVDKHTRKG
jgi:hypothetical protein